MAALRLRALPSAQRDLPLAMTYIFYPQKVARLFCDGAQEAEEHARAEDAENQADDGGRA